ncbi:MAG TPA: alkaline phosphatase family protein [Acidimicrobiales bacterium]|nr:alkaline phosphatase family protein [Acidimicrobiales bacterium]
MLSRRRFLQAALGASVATACQGGRAVGRPPARQPTTTSPATRAGSTAPFDTVIVVMMENRSFDHLLGWLPGADGRQAGLTFPDITGRRHPTHDLGLDVTGCGNTDPDHSWPGGQIQLDGGKMDGWLLTPHSRSVADVYPIGYYTPATLPVLAALAQNYATLDGYFCSIMAETYPNRIYLHAGRTDRDHNLDPPGVSPPPNKVATIPTIWDRLGAAGVSRRYYYGDTPFLGLWGLKYFTIFAPYSQFLTEAAAGILPHVSFLDPTFNNDQNLEADQHPFADVQVGDRFLAQVYHAVRTSPQWSRTVLVVTWDEWGGFYDHVTPPRVVDDTDPATVDHRCGVDGCGGPPDYRQLGFRVPAIVISPWSPAGVVHGGPYEHTSILRMIESRWNLPPLTARDANAKNLADVLNFNAPNTVAAGAIPSPAIVPGKPCA